MRAGRMVGTHVDARSRHDAHASDTLEYVEESRVGRPEVNAAKLRSAVCPDQDALNRSNIHALNEVHVRIDALLRI